MPAAAASEKSTTPAYGAQGQWSTAGQSAAAAQAVPAPPNPLWLIPSPMNAHRRDTTSTLSVAQATAMLKAVIVSNRNGPGMGIVRPHSLFHVPQVQSWPRVRQSPLWVLLVQYVVLP